MKYLLVSLAIAWTLCLSSYPCSGASDTDLFKPVTPVGEGGAPSQICAFGDSLFGFVCETPSGDNQCLGIEFDGEYFYVTGGGGTGSPDPNKIHFFDRDGNYLTSIDQPTTSYWCWRDMAFDGAHLYSSDSDIVVEWFVTGLPDAPALNIVGSFPGPLDPNRAMAHDPASDHFFTASFVSDIYEFDRAGTTIGSWSNTYSIYGMAWDDVSTDGPWLWIFTQEAPGAIVYQWDPIGHAYTGLALELTHVGGIAGGAAFTTDWNPRLGVLFCLHQTNPDAVVGYEIGPVCKPVEPPEMRSQGYWRRQCKDEAHEAICAYLDSVFVLADLFDVFDCDSICGLMKVDPPERDMCRKARKQFMALLLNVASGKLSLCNCLDDGRTVGDAVAELDSLLLGSPDRTVCEHANWMADGINTGETVVLCENLSRKIVDSRNESVATLAIPGRRGGGMVLKYELATQERVRLEIYDKTGRFLRRLADREQGPGSCEITWDGRDERGQSVPSGICFFRLETGRAVRRGKVILLR